MTTQVQANNETNAENADSADHADRSGVRAARPSAEPLEEVWFKTPPSTRIRVVTLPPPPPDTRIDDEMADAWFR